MIDHTDTQFRERSIPETLARTLKGETLYACSNQISDQEYQPGLNPSEHKALERIIIEDQTIGFMIIVRQERFFDDDDEVLKVHFWFERREFLVAIEHFNAIDRFFGQRELKDL